ncbi:MAG TPA: hypothetical protein VL098_14355 [Flavipsychrobacter sp.]|nr:hypothetical protein [Flavipsychrobacter sp.]
MHKALAVVSNAMTPLPTEDIIKFLKANISPLPDSIYGDGYRASVTLTDDLYLPCVVFRNSSKVLDLAVRRFKEEQSGKSIFSKSSGLGYGEIVKTFVASGNCINHYDIAKVDTSDFAFPEQILQQIHGETKMAWTGFIAKMKNGKQFSFGTSLLFDFFDMPKGYSPNDIAEIINHSYLDKEGNLKSYHAPEVYEEFDRSLVFRERPYFECYLDSL